MTKDEALRLALDALEYADEMIDTVCVPNAITAINEALAQPEHDTEAHYKGVIDDVQKLFDDKRKAQPEQEPVAWEDGPHMVMRSDMRDRLNYKGPWVDMDRAIPDKWIPVLYTTPPQRTWVSLTDEELSEVYNQADWDTVNGWEYERAIEAKSKEKNT